MVRRRARWQPSPPLHHFTRLLRYNRPNAGLLILMIVRNVVVLMLLGGEFLLIVRIQE